MVQRARKVVWSSLARASRISIFSYWNERNKSTFYSKKLNQQFAEAINQIETFPESTRSSNNENIRLKIVSHFEIVYFLTETHLYIVDIWDTRQNPENFPIK